MIGILKAIGIWLYKAYFFLPNLAVSFYEAHFKGDWGGLITLGALFTVLGLQGMLAGLLIRLIAGEMPPMENKGNEGNGFEENDFPEDDFVGDCVCGVYGPNMCPGLDNDDC